MASPSVFKFVVQMMDRPDRMTFSNDGIKIEDINAKIEMTTIISTSEKQGCWAWGALFAMLFGDLLMLTIRTIILRG